MLQGIPCARVALVLLVVCCYSTQAALAQIAPTNSATISGSVSDSIGKPVAHAKVSLSGPKSTSTQTDAQGLFVFIGVPFGTYSISAAAIGLGTATRSVSVQGDVNVAIQYEPASMNGLKVIANVSSSANAQFNVTPASITQVNPIANAFEGKTSWRTILEQIPGVAQAGLFAGNDFVAAYPDGPLVPVKLSINGALPYETATLLDNMPLIGTAFNDSFAGGGTDLSVYPLNAFAAADVVRGPGANAPSIVDSIGGSFVLHAPGIVTANHYEFSASTDAYGGIVSNVLAAIRWNRLSAVVTYGVNDSPGPLSSTGMAWTNLSAVNGLPFYQTFTELTNPKYASSQNPFYGLQTSLLACCFNQSSAWSQHSGSVALTYAFSPRVNAEVFYAGQNSLSSMGGSPQNYTTQFVPPAGYTGSLPAGTYLLSTTGATPLSSPVQRSSSLLEEKITAQLRGGMLTIAALQNRDFSKYTIVQGDQLPVQLYGGGTWNGSPSIFDGGSYNAALFFPFINAISCWSVNNDLLVSYATPIGMNFHVGASFVKSNYNIPSEAFISYPSYGLNYYQIIPSAILETTNEMRFFVGGNLSEKTSLDLSMYFVNANYHIPNPNSLASFYTPGVDINYIDSNYTYAAPRLGFVWRPTPAVAVRAAAGGGFAEAPLGDLVGSNAPSCFGAPVCAVTSPNLNLQPEKSFGFDLGTDIKLPRNTVLSFDVYHTNLYGQLYSSTTSSGSCPSCGGLPLYVTQYGNLGESRYEGVLVDLHHDVPRGIAWSLSGGLTRGYVVSVPAAGFYNGTTGYPYTPCTNCANLNVVPGVNFNGTFAGSVPYSQALGTLAYRWSPEKYVDLVGTYYGNNNTYFRPAFVELNGDVSYLLTKNVSVLVTFRNITGIYDGSVQAFTLANMSGAPTISGLPYPLYGEDYGPRTVILTTRLSL